MIRNVLWWPRTNDLAMAAGKCPEAYVLLASRCGADYEQILGFFAKAEAASERSFKEFTAQCATGDVWAMIELRAYFRAVLGSATILRKMGR